MSGHNIELAPGEASLAMARRALGQVAGTVLAAAPPVSLGRQLTDLRGFVGRLFNRPPLGGTRVAGERPWNLALLADLDVYQRHFDAVAVALADIFTFKVHLNGAELAAAHAVFVESFIEAPVVDPGQRDFIDIVVRLIVSVSTRRMVTYTTMIRDRDDPFPAIVAKWPGEVTALLLGGGVYAAEVRRLTGVDPGVPLAPLYLENAAALLRANPSSARKFRELLQLATPWT